MDKADHSGLHVLLRQQRPIPLDVMLDCGPGELLALVGPSGAGKSTVLRCIAGLHSPQAGHISCDGNAWYDSGQARNIPAHRRSVGMVFQSYALFPHMTAAGNVMAALGHLPSGKRAARAEELLRQVNLTGLETRYPAELSGGQQQRVAVARALAREPAALLLDEPFSAVDRSTRQRLYRELAELRKELQIPAILVTHDLDEAALLADRLCLLHHGRTLQTGSPQEVMTRPASVEAARLVDVRNIFTGRIAGHDGERELTLLEWSGYRLEVPHDPSLAPGTQINWAIPTANVLLHRRDRPSRGEHENPVPGTISEFVILGDNASVAVAVDGIAETPLFMSIPLHAARRNHIGVGERVTVSLLTSSIHIIPPEGSGKLVSEATSEAEMRSAEPISGR